MSHFPAGGETGVSLVRIYVSGLLRMALSWLVSRRKALREAQRKVNSRTCEGSEMRLRDGR